MFRNHKLFEKKNRRNVAKDPSFCVLIRLDDTIIEKFKKNAHTELFFKHFISVYI